jgi:hypothetical protein
MEQDVAVAGWGQYSSDVCGGAKPSLNLDFLCRRPIYIRYLFLLSLFQLLTVQ